MKKFTSSFKNDDITVLQLTKYRMTQFPIFIQYLQKMGNFQHGRNEGSNKKQGQVSLPENDMLTNCILKFEDISALRMMIKVISTMIRIYLRSIFWKSAIIIYLLKHVIEIALKTRSNNQN
jgi:hypothetical protein